MSSSSLANVTLVQNVFLPSTHDNSHYPIFHRLLTANLPIFHSSDWSCHPPLAIYPTSHFSHHSCLSNQHVHICCLITSLMCLILSRIGSMMTLSRQIQLSLKSSRSIVFVSFSVRFQWILSSCIFRSSTSKFSWRILLFHVPIIFLKSLSSQHFIF